MTMLRCFADEKYAAANAKIGRKLYRLSVIGVISSDVPSDLRLRVCVVERRVRAPAGTRMRESKGECTSRCRAVSGISAGNKAFLLLGGAYTSVKSLHPP